MAPAARTELSVTHPSSEPVGSCCRLACLSRSGSASELALVVRARAKSPRTARRIDRRILGKVHQSYGPQGPCAATLPRLLQMERRSRLARVWHTSLLEIYGSIVRNKGMVQHPRKSEPPSEKNSGWWRCDLDTLYSTVTRRLEQHSWALYHLFVFTVGFPIAAPDPFRTHHWQGADSTAFLTQHAADNVRPAPNVRTNCSALGSGRRGSGARQRAAAGHECP